MFDGERIVDTHIGNDNILPKTERFRLEGIPFLPKDMDIINDNLPIGYCDNTKFEYFSFNFNTHPVKEQLMNNIEHINDSTNIINYTWFILNDQKYIIMFIKNLSILDIKEKLNNNEIFLTMGGIIFGTNTFSCF